MGAITPMQGVVPDGVQKAPPAPMIAYPSWMDGRYMTVACIARGPQFVTTDADGRAIIPGNAQRWCLMVVHLFMVGTLKFSPWPDPDQYAWWTTTSANDVLRVSIFEWGPIVTGEIYVFGAQSERVQYTELVTH